MTAPERLRALLAQPDLVVMPAVWDGISAKLAAAAGFKPKCNDKDNCCTFDTKKLGAWVALEKVCFVDNKPGTVFFVAPKK